MKVKFLKECKVKVNETVGIKEFSEGDIYDFLPALGEHLCNLDYAEAAKPSKKEEIVGKENKETDPAQEGSNVVKKDHNKMMNPNYGAGKQ